MAGIVLTLISLALACTGMSHEELNPIEALSSVLLSFNSAFGREITNTARGGRLAVRSPSGNLALLLHSKSTRQGSNISMKLEPFSRERRHLLLRAAAATATSLLLPQESLAASEVLKQAKVESDFIEGAKMPDNEVIVRADEIGKVKLRRPPDYIQLNVDLPLSSQKIQVLQPYGATIKAMKFSDNISSDDQSAVQVWGAGSDLCRGASTGILRMSPDGKVKPVVLKGRRVLELGSGTGVGGMGAAFGGAKSVVLTDGNLDVLKVLERNVGLNKLSGTTVSRLRWGNTEDEKKVFATGPFEVIIASEVGYQDDELADLFGTIRRCMEFAKKNGVAKPEAVLQVTLLEDDDAGLPVRSFKAYEKAAQNANLKIANRQDVNDSERIVFNLA